jgi:hypothetical protein
MDATGDDMTADSGKPAKEKKKSRKSKSEHSKSERKSIRKGKKKSSSAHAEGVEWDKSSKDIDEGDWKSEDMTKSPSEWDPKKFDKQASQRWKESDSPKHAQDLPSPAVADAPEGGKGSGDEWPFKKTYAVDEKRKSKSKRTKEKGLSAPKRVKSVEEAVPPRKDKSSSSKKEKKSKRKSSSRSSSSGRHRRSKDDEDDEAAEVSDEDDQVIPLKGGDDDNEDDYQDQDQGQSGRRRMMKKKSSERFNTAVKHEPEEESIIDERARQSLDDATDELDQYSRHSSRSRHSSHSRHSSQSFSDDASFDSDEDEAHSYDFDKSVGTYDSGAEEGGEDYEEQPRYFQTPGMMDYDEEIAELMHKANPEYTEHLNRRVHHRKDNVTYDKNMPMMTRQALMTRQASAQAMRQTVDANSIDKGQLGFRNDSFHGRNGGAQKPQRRGPGKRAPPRSKSSGLGTMQLSSRRGGEDAASDDPRSRFGGKGASTSFQRYANKPNNVARMSGRRPADMDRSQRGTREPPRRGMQRRSKSSTTLGRSQSADGNALVPERRARRTAREVSDDDSDIDEPSSEEEDEGADPESDPTKLRTKPRRRAPKKNVDKQDMTVKRHRRKLHGLMYQVKMSVEMKELLKEVQKGEVPKSPIKSLLMDEP